MDERWEVATGVALNVLYCVAILAMVVAAVPPLRMRLAGLARQQAHAWRYGRWLASRAQPPRWTSMLERDDLPQEQA